MARSFRARPFMLSDSAAFDAVSVCLQLVVSVWRRCSGRRVVVVSVVEWRRRKRDVERWRWKFKGKSVR